MGNVFSKGKRLYSKILIHLNFFQKIKFLRLCLIYKYSFYKYNKHKQQIVNSKEINIIKFKNFNIALSNNLGDMASLLEILLLGEYDALFRLNKDFSIKPFTMVDVGANIGLNYIYFKDRNLLNKYIGVEPLPENLRLLNFNSYSKITKIIPKALYISNSKVYFTESEAGNSNYVFENGSLEVETITLSNILIEIENSDDIFLKLDIEGAEYKILDQDLDLISNKVKYIAIEFHDIKNHEYKNYFEGISKNFYTIEENKSENLTLVFGVNKNL